MYRDKKAQPMTSITHITNPERIQGKNPFNDINHIINAKIAQRSSRCILINLFGRPACNVFRAQAAGLLQAPLRFFNQVFRIPGPTTLTADAFLQLDTIPCLIY